MIRALLVLLLLLPFASQSSEAFVFSKNVYSSPIEGKIHWKGKPLPNLKVTRTLESGGLKNGYFSDMTVTNPEGFFEFSVIENRTLFRPDLISANPVISQLIKVAYNGDNYLIWYFRKPDMKLGSESTGVKLELDCDISLFEIGGESRIVRCKSNGVNQ